MNVRPFTFLILLQLGISAGFAQSTPAPQGGPMAQWPAGAGGTGHCYQAFSVPSGITWDAAQAFAVKLGGYLATITSANENDFVFNLVDDPAYWISDPAGASVGPWLGGIRLGGAASANSWLWVKDDGAITFTHWAPSKPDAKSSGQDRLCFWAAGQNNPESTWGSRAANLPVNGFVVEYDNAPNPTSHADAPDLAPTAATAQSDSTTNWPVTLAEGDPAPALVPASWIKGEPVKEFEKGKVYVVEFWATWCGPCRASIPHLTEMQKKYPAVTFIGQDVWETNQADVVPFVQQMGDQMDYRVAMDDVSKSREGAMATSWMRAAGQNGIPTAFLVDKDGKVAWIGHPMELEPYLQQLLAGTLDSKRLAVDRKAQNEFGTKIDGLMGSRQWSAAVQAARDFDQSHPGVLQLPALLCNIFVYVQAQDPTAAQALEPTIFDALKDDVTALSNIALLLATSPQLTVHDVPFALKLANRAVEVSKGQNRDALETLAQIYASQGDNAKADLYHAQAAKLPQSPDKVAASAAAPQ